MSVHESRSRKRVLRFLATSAVVVAPASMIACGGTDAAQPDTPHTNVGPEAAPEGSNLDHTAEPHTNVAPVEDAASEGEPPPDGEAVPEGEPAPE